MNLTNNKKEIKHKVIYDKLCDAIIKGTYKPGEKLPTENELAEMFDTSRPTIGRAMRDLQQKGLITRKQGRGTFVLQNERPAKNTLGLLIHWQVSPVQTANTSIFGVMIPDLLQYASRASYSLLLNDLPKSDYVDYVQRAQAICQHLLNSHVAGVFFTPLELSMNNSLNVQIAEKLTKAGIAVVLLDRDLTDSYHRSQFDIVGINHEQSSLILTHHLIELGCRKIDFVSRAVNTTAINHRYLGYRLALEENNIRPEKNRLHQIETSTLMNPNSPEGKKLLKLVKSDKTEAFVCVNDHTAADLINFFVANGVKIPQDVRIVGFDDLPMDKNLPVSLTTIRQNTSALAYEAVRTITDRIDNPQTPARQIMVSADLIIRDSCGSHQKRNR